MLTKQRFLFFDHAAANKGFLMSTDGTTVAQRKIGGVAENDMVISANE